jgi:hypothetical protein
MRNRTVISRFVYAGIPLIMKMHLLGLRGTEFFEVHRGESMRKAVESGWVCSVISSYAPE